MGWTRLSACALFATLILIPAVLGDSAEWIVVIETRLGVWRRVLLIGAELLIGLMELDEHSCLGSSRS